MLRFICHCRSTNTLFAIKIKHSARFLHFHACQLGMNSMQVKKSNILGKPENNLITPNEYTLDLLPLINYLLISWNHKYQLIMFTQETFGMKTSILYRLSLLETQFGNKRCGQIYLSK